MKVTLKNAPQSVSANTTGKTTATERALQAFANPTPAQVASANGHPVNNPSNVSVEELGAIKPVSKAPEVPQENMNPSPSVESVPEVSVEQPKQDPLSSQYALLAKQERSLRIKAQRQEQALKAKEAELQAREDAYKAKDLEYQQNYIPKSKLSEDTITTLLENGISYDQITQMVMNQGSVQTDPALKLAIQRLENQVKQQAENQDKAQKAYQEEQSRQYQQALTQIKSETRQLINSDERFEVIKKTNSSKDVVDLIERTFSEDGILLSVEQACEEVESHLTDKYKILNDIKKLQKQQQQSAAPAQNQGQPAKQSQPGQIKTLTNASGVNRPLSSTERAMLAFKGEFKR